MTDAEINLAIAKIEYPTNELCQCRNQVDVRLGDGDYITVDYINNWENIGPIIEREGIALKRDTYHWEAYCRAEDPSSFWVHYAHAETPTKAAALCYLKMKESE